MKGWHWAIIIGLLGLVGGIIFYVVRRNSTPTDAAGMTTGASEALYENLDTFLLGMKSYLPQSTAAGLFDQACRSKDFSKWEGKFSKDQIKTLWEKYSISSDGAWDALICPRKFIIGYIK